MTSTNIPGKQSNTVPKKLRGNYQLELPEDMAAFMGEEYKMSVMFNKKSLVVNDGYNDSEMKIGDSIFISLIGKTNYLTMGAAPNYSVFKMKKYDADIYLFPLFVEADTKAEQIQSYFTSALDVPESVDENGELSSPSISVTINDSKLESFYGSPFCVKDSFKLKFIGKKK
jgi:hypothetical protein